MAERFTSKNLARRMYVPEERPGYEEYIADPENQRMAEEAAMGLLSLLTGPLGQVPRAINIARNLGRGSQLIPRPDRGNAMRPEEMLQLEGPPPMQALPRPSRPQMTDDELQAMELARMVGEGGPSFGTQEAARRAVRRRPTEEETQAMERARMEDEGGIDPAQASLLRALRKDRERRQEEEDIMRFEGEGGGAYNYTGPRYKYGLPATQGSRDVMSYGQPGGRAMISYGQPGGLPTMASGRGGGDLMSPNVRFSREEGQPALQPPNPLRSALALTAPMNNSAEMTLFGGVGGGGGGGIGGGMTPSMAAGSAANMQPPVNAPAPNRGPNIPNDVYESYTRAIDPTREQPMSPEDMDQINAAKRFPTFDDNAMTYRARQEFDDAVRYRELVDSGRLDRANFEDENAVPNPGRTITPVERRALAVSTRTPPAQQAAPSTSSLFDRYNETGNAADFVRADRAMMQAMRDKQDIGYYGQPEDRKSGGAVSGSDAALQQALGIVNRLLAERR